GWDRATAMGYNSSVLSTATASYPALGGLLAALGWYYPFALPLFAIPIGLLVIFSLRNPEPHNEQGMREYFGSVWHHLWDRQVAGLLFLSLGTFVVLFGPQIFYLPILMGDSFGSSPVFIGMVLSSASLVSALAASQLGRLSGYFEPTTLMKAAFLLYPVALCLIPLAPNPWLLLVPAAVFGVAQGLNIPNILTLLNGLAPDENRGAFMSVNGMILRLGQTLGPVLMGAAAVGIGISGAYYAAAALTGVMFLVAVATLR
ncbi:MAG: MFS transporter, partial [Rubrobacter sp.]|nr:MFS transporter [Rubrobacter sp.]